jgi:hypothetical protein
MVRKLAYADQQSLGCCTSADATSQSAFLEVEREPPDPQARRPCRHRRADRQSHFPADRHHELPGENGGTLKYWQDAAREARNHQHRITCGPAGPDRDALAAAYRSEHQFAGAPLGSIVRQRR